MDCKENNESFIPVSVQDVRSAVVGGSWNILNGELNMNHDWYFGWVFQCQSLKRDAVTGTRMHPSSTNSPNQSCHDLNCDGRIRELNEHFQVHFSLTALTQSQTLYLTSQKQILKNVNNSFLVEDVPHFHQFHIYP